MESLGEILKKRQTAINISGDATATSSGAEQRVEAVSLGEVCPLCQGRGWRRVEVPLGHPDFGKAIPCQCTELKKEEGRLDRLRRYSNLGPLTRLTFDNLLPRGRTANPANQERFYQAYQAARGFAENPQGWLVLTGASGCGKTHLAAAIANHCLAQGRPVFFVVVPDLLDHLRSTFSPTSDVTYDQLFEEVRNTPLLILDDLGTQSATPWAQEKLFQIINQRFNAQLPTVVTTNVTLEKLDDRLRTRLTEPSLSQVFLLEEKSLPLLERLGSLSLELLSQMTFENFDAKGLNLSLEQRRNLQEVFRLARRFAEQPEGWLVFTGGHGCGKTHLAAAIANYRLRAGQSVFFVVVPDLLDHLRFTFSPESRVTYDEFFERVKTAPLLILDDFGEQSTTPWAREKLYQILNYRYNARLPTVITTCYSLDEIEGRISSRLVDPRLSLVFNIMAPDYRGDLKLAEKPPLTGRRARRIG